MISILSPAKNLDFTDVSLSNQTGYPEFREESVVLMKKLKKLSARQIAKLMKLSPALAELNFNRYQEWDPDYENALGKPAVHAFNGEVYRGLNVSDFDEKDLHFGQDHLVMLSGLHGILRPLDRIQPYRLEMGTSLKVTAKTTSLYKFWNDKLAKNLNQKLVSHKHKVLVNLASTEYIKAIRTPALEVPLIDCVFMDWKKGSYQVVMTWAKLARGMMAREIIKQRIDDVNELKKVSFNGYTYNAGLSEKESLVFTRKNP